MIEVKRVFPECWADTMLVELILQRGRPAHYHGINNEGIALHNYKGSDFVIGLVDTDKFKRKDPKIELFTEVVEDSLHDHQLLIKKIPDTNKHLIRIHPEFEPWIWNLAFQCGIDPKHAQYGFETIGKFADASKSEDAFDNKNLKKFINAVVQKNPPPIQTLRIWLSKVF